MENLERHRTFTRINKPFTNFLMRTFPSLILRDQPRKSHRKKTEEVYRQLKVIVLPVLKDNYSYLLIDLATKFAAAIDPANVESLLEILEEEDLTLQAVLSTHHHSDHVMGNKDLIAWDPSLRVYGGDQRIPYLTDLVAHHDLIKVGKQTIQCINTPCHTSGHMCYYIKPQWRVPGIVFTGDSLFVGGCGRLFEGKAEAIYQSFQRLAALPGPTMMFCGHEYTITNLKFALQVEPLNEEIAQKLTWALKKRDDDEPTVPSTIDEEKSMNPFLRLDEPSVQKYTKSTDSLKTLKRLRQRNKRFF